MQAQILFIAPHVAQAGTSIVTMGIIERLKGRLDKIAFFMPIVHNPQKTRFYLDHYELDMPHEASFGYTVSEVERLIARNRFDEVLEGLMDKIKHLRHVYDFIVIQGIHKKSFSASVDFDVNLEIGKNINTPFIRVLSANGNTIDQIEAEVRLSNEAFAHQGCSIQATFINRVDTQWMEALEAKKKEDRLFENCFFLPEITELDRPTMAEVSQSLGCIQISGNSDELRRVVMQSKIAAMTLEHFITYLQEGDLIIVPGDRTDIILATLIANYSQDFPSLAGILLTGGMVPDPKIMQLVKGVTQASFPILSIADDTYGAALKVTQVVATIDKGSERKIALAMGLFNRYTDLSAMDEALARIPIETLTPTMFKYRLFERAQQQKKTIVLPESSDERILRATEILLRRDIVDIILLGDPLVIQTAAAALALDISKAVIVDPMSSKWLEPFSQKFYELRKHKGFQRANAKDTVLIPAYFGTMMVHEGMADGMVCGALYTTQETLRPALQIIKTKPDVSVVSSVFFMCLATKVLVYGDCAVNQDPNAQVLSDIALSSAQTAQAFGIEPKVAMLSYSTGHSGQGSDVDKVRTATELFRRANPTVPVEGPIQYDAAIDPVVAGKKLPHSAVAGKATVYIFPDLNTGNNTYKAVQRSANAIAIGPILQGLNKPINDLSRGCLVADIVNTVAITAIQAQQS